MIKFIKKKLSRADQLATDKRQFGSRAHMLDTLHMAYLHALDQIPKNFDYIKITKSIAQIRGWHQRCDGFEFFDGCVILF